MKVRVSLTIDYELADQEAHEKYGVVDAVSVAQAMQAEADKQLTETFTRENGVVNASCTVHPLYG